MIITTPQPSREQDNPRRNSFESELWDDLSTKIFFTDTSTISVPMPVQGRILVTAMARLNGAGVLLISVNSVGATSTPSVTAAGSLVAVWATDVEPGIITVEVTSAAVLSNLVITVQRGTRPDA